MPSGAPTILSMLISFLTIIGLAWLASSSRAMVVNDELIDESGGITKYRCCCDACTYIYGSECIQCHNVVNECHCGPELCSCYRPEVFDDGSFDSDRRGGCTTRNCYKSYDKLPSTLLTLNLISW